MWLAKMLHVPDRKNLQNVDKKCGESFPQVPRLGRVLIKERWAWRVLPSGAIVRRGGETAEVSAPARN
jgi:hypothetical protein